MLKLPHTKLHRDLRVGHSFVFARTPHSQILESLTSRLTNWGVRVLTEILPGEVWRIIFTMKTSWLPAPSPSLP